MSAPAATTSHEHVDGQCDDCYRIGRRSGKEEGYADAAEEYQDVIDGGRANGLDEAKEAAVEAHREARHEGLWEYCSDPICSALERWFHFEGVR